MNTLSSPPDKGRGMPYGIHTVDSLRGFFKLIMGDHYLEMVLLTQLIDSQVPYLN